MVTAALVALVVTPHPMGRPDSVHRKRPFDMYERPIWSADPAGILRWREMNSRVTWVAQVGEAIDKNDLAGAARIMDRVRQISSPLFWASTRANIEVKRGTAGAMLRRELEAKKQRSSTDPEGYPRDLLVGFLTIYDKPATTNNDLENFNRMQAVSRFRGKFIDPIRPKTREELFAILSFHSARYDVYGVKEALYHWTKAGLSDEVTRLLDAMVASHGGVGSVTLQRIEPKRPPWEVPEPERRARIMAELLFENPNWLPARGYKLSFLPWQKGTSTVEEARRYLSQADDLERGTLRFRCVQKILDHVVSAK